MASPIITVIAEIFKFLFNLVIDLLCFAAFLVSLAAPWRWPWIFLSFAKAGGDGGRQSIRMCAWGQLFCSIVDWVTFPLGVVTLFTWRSCHMIGAVHSACGESHGRDLQYNHKVRFELARHAFYVATDIPFILMAILTTVMVWRGWKFWKRLCSKLGGGHKAWHRTGCRELIAVECLKGVIDIFAIPFGLLIILTVYRVPVLKSEIKRIEEEEADEHQRVLQQKMAFAVQAGYVLLDFVFFLLGVVVVATVLRIPSLVRGWRAIRPGSTDMAWDRRKLVALQVPLALRDWLALLGLAIVLASVYRGVLAVSRLMELCADQADPTPHAVITRLTPELPPRGLRIHIEAQKTPDLTIGAAKAYVRDEQFWNVAEGRISGAGMAKMFLPLNMVPGVLDPADFRAGETEVRTTLTFNWDVSRKAILSNLSKLGEGTDIPIQVEFGSHEGTLFRLKLNVGDFLQCADQEGRELDLGTQPSRDSLAGQTTAGLLRCAKKVPGAHIFDVLWKVVLLQIAMFVVDLIALVCFILLHLIPWRAWAMWAKVRENKATRSKRRAVDSLGDLLYAISRRDPIVERTLADVERRAKNREVSHTKPQQSGGERQWWFGSTGRYWYKRRDTFTITSQNDSDVTEYAEYLQRAAHTAAVLDGAEGMVEPRDVVRRIAGHELHIMLAHCRALHEHLGSALSTVAAASAEDSVHEVQQPPLNMLGMVAAAGDRASRSASSLTAATAGSAPGGTRWVESTFSEYGFGSELLTRFGVTEAELRGGLTDEALARELAAEGGTLPPRPAGTIQDGSSPVSSQQGMLEEEGAAPAVSNVGDEAVDAAYGRAAAARARAEAAIREAVQLLGEVRSRVKAEISCSGRCGGGDGWQQARSVIYGEVRQFAYDLAAFISVIVTFCSVYRIYTLVTTMRRARNKRYTALWNVGQIGVDLIYLARALCVIAAIRHCLHMPADVVGWVLERKSFKAARQVVAWYFQFVLSDLLQMVTFVFAWRTVKVSLACAVFGVFAPAFLADHLVFRGNGGKCPTVTLLLLCTAVLWGGPCLVAYKLAPDGSEAAGLGAMYGIIGTMCFASVASGLCFALPSFREGCTIQATHARYVRLNWFNLAQYLYIFLEVAVPLAAVWRVPPSSKWASELSDASRYLLLDFGEEWAAKGATFGFWFAIAVAAAWYLIGSIPVVSNHILPELFREHDDCSANRHWVFAMGLLGRGLALAVLWNLARLLSCPAGSAFAGSCWSGEHQKLGLLALMFSMLYITTTCARLPWHSDRKCGVLDVRFVELYDAGLSCILSAGVMGAAFAQGAPAAVPSAVIATAALLAIAWTLSCPRLLHCPRLCSVDAVAAWRLAGHFAVLCGAVAGIVGAATDDGSPVPAGILIIGCGVPMLGAIANSIRLRCLPVQQGADVTPEQVQEALVSLAVRLQSCGLLNPRFEMGSWRGAVKRALRASPLALLTMRLEDAVRMRALKTVCLGQRPSWYQDCWGLVRPDDEERDFERFVMSWDAAMWEVYCDCFCDCEDRDRYSSDKGQPDEAADLAKLSELVQGLANGAALAPRATVLSPGCGGAPQQPARRTMPGAPQVLDVQSLSPQASAEYQEMGPDGELSL
eukprot:TRINITY_DN3882_c0_g1_i1.p1 TRINITY_DN3882_c0_g1~~TRINITY_DN3882_c0_g1_i1.p1  ORF type:complete len:1648 (+),score=486.83 TRINITY_DN3882_c0_g1_i1:138-4946(+)